MKKRTLKYLTMVGVIVGALAVSTTAIVSAGGFEIETAKIKISLDLKSPTGAKVIFQRAD